jgi:hypothetical protein
MYSETSDFYKQNISNDEKIKLVPPDGTAFDTLPKDIYNMNKTEIQSVLLKNINKIISLCDVPDSKNATDALQILGVYVALGGLVTVSKEARDSYPDIIFAFN